MGVAVVDFVDKEDVRSVELVEAVDFLMVLVLVWWVELLATVDFLVLLMLVWWLELVESAIVPMMNSRLESQHFCTSIFTFINQFETML